jgi:autoinducer 2-degrading protein
MEKIMIVHAQVKATKIELFLQLAQPMVKASLSESGCLAYELTRNVQVPNEFLIYEKYKDEAALLKHKTSSHLKTFTDAVMPLLSEAPLMNVYHVEQ